MIQIAAGNYIFLIDLFIIRSQSSLFIQTAVWIRSIMMSKSLLKVFFDCHKDSEALHKGLDCCIENVYDIQAMYMLLRQWKTEEQSNFTLASPGLNKSLEEYKASHGVNQYKEIMKKIFSMKSGSYEIRPLSLMYIKYAAKDVEDLIEVKDKMLAELNTLFKKGKGKKILEVLSKEYVKRGCKSMLVKNDNNDEEQENVKMN